MSIPLKLVIEVARTEVCSPRRLLEVQPRSEVVSERESLATELSFVDLFPLLMPADVEGSRTVATCIIVQRNITSGLKFFTKIRHAL